MPELVVGLAPGKTSYYDKYTNLYITLEKPVQKVVYQDYRQLKGICHALFASVPALVLYEGNIPQEAIDEWKSKYQKMFYSPKTKNIVENGKVIGTVPFADPVRNSMDYIGRPIDSNRAFDRPDKVNAESADVVTVSTGEAEEVELEVKAQEVEQAEEEQAQAEAVEQEEKKATSRGKRGSNSKSGK